MSAISQSDLWKDLKASGEQAINDLCNVKLPES
jgi:hypothetical protein